MGVDESRTLRDIVYDVYELELNGVWNYRGGHFDSSLVAENYAREYSGGKKVMYVVELHRVNKWVVEN